MPRRRSTTMALLTVVGLAVPLMVEPSTGRRTLRRTLTFEDPGPHRLVVDNVWGSIKVRGHGGDTVEMVAEETIRAESLERVERARREVTIDIRQGSGEIELYVDGPFRCKERRGSRNCWNRWDDLYAVVYDFEISVPFATELEVRTVTDGDIEVSDVRGDFRVHNVNGAIEMTGLAGSGEAETVNGELLVSFASNPGSNSRFQTVNGKIDVTFQSDLSADLEMIARWGELWTEYEVVPLPSPPPTRKTEGDRTIIEIPRGLRLRVEAGGPTHSFETLNGNIFVRKGTSERGDDDA